MEIMLTPPSTGEITQYYANGSDRGVHSGNDYAYSSGGKIHANAVAMDDGIVEWAEDTRKLPWPNKWYFNIDFDRSDAADHSAGIAVVLRHRYGWTTYCHLSETPLNIGQEVKRDQYVGTVGQTGFSLGKHLHAELILDDHDFSTPTGGRADLNLYMVDKIIPVSNTVGEWFEMVDEATLRKVVSEILDEKLAEFKSGISGVRKAGKTYADLDESIKQKLDGVSKEFRSGISGVREAGPTFAALDEAIKKTRK